MWWSTLAGKLEHAKVLDPLADGLNTVVDTVLPKGAVKDGLHGRWLGHALHPLLVALPIGMWSGSLLFDLTGEQKAAKRLVGAGLLAVAPTAAAGLADWSELGSARRPKRVGLVHAAANTASTALFAASWFARSRGDHGRGRTLSLAGAATMAAGGYLGGHLSYSQGVGVNRNADEAKKPRAWTDAAAADDVAEGQLHRLELDGQSIVLARRNGAVHAMGATCSHWGAPLEQGELAPGTSGETCLVCPWHASAFRLDDGSVARGPATSPQTSYEVRTVGARLELRVRP